MTPEELKEVVGYAEGFSWRESGTRRKVPSVHVALTGIYRADSLPESIIAALASQLIEQVDAMDMANFEVFENAGDTTIRDNVTGDLVVTEFGPNRKENSIRACLEFYRGRG